MTPPPPYARTPYLIEPVGGARDDAVLAPLQREQWLNSPVLVEEKLDGANVSIWQHDGRLEVASRGGPTSMDRGRQLGRLRGWVAEHEGQLRNLTTGGWGAYGEWLWLSHSVLYDRLPDLLVVLDLWHPSRDCIAPDERDRRCGEVGLTCPPRLFLGTLTSTDRLLKLLGQSSYSSTAAMEGAVLRDQQRRRCKVLRPGFLRRQDEEWKQARGHNQVGRPVTVRSGP